MDSLHSLLEEDAKRIEWQTYVAMVGWSIGRSMYKDYAIPVYTELISHGAKDNRSGEQIVDDLADKLRRRKRNRGEDK